ncbi:MAG: hypothetical protein GX808_07905 [Syntrophomonadaceae bacterium]|jgi:hypothetical protein|nr:hypothetical protein [Syntrophomonadaceae bacterium]
MLSTFALHPAASKHIIARAVVKLPEVQQALKNGRIIVGSGTTNINVLEQLLNISLEDKSRGVAGVITQKVSCITDPDNRYGNWCIENGKLIEADWLDFLDGFKPGDVFIKGANAVDPTGDVGVLVANSQGGTIGQAIGALRARGIIPIFPVGLEKMIPSCKQAEKVMGIYKDEYNLGIKVGFIALSNTQLITEIEALKILFGIDAIQVAAGGVGGMEGSVVLAADCESEAQAKDLLNLVKKANRISPLKINKRKCSECNLPCYFREKN